MSKQDDEVLDLEDEEEETCIDPLDKNSQQLIELEFTYDVFDPNNFFEEDDQPTNQPYPQPYPQPQPQPQPQPRPQPLPQPIIREERPRYRAPSPDVIRPRIESPEFIRPRPSTPIPAPNINCVNAPSANKNIYDPDTYRFKMCDETSQNRNFVSTSNLRAEEFRDSNVRFQSDELVRAAETFKSNDSFFNQKPIVQELRSAGPIKAEYRLDDQFATLNRANNQLRKEEDSLLIGSSASGSYNGETTKAFHSGNNANYNAANNFQFKEEIKQQGFQELQSSTSSSSFNNLNSLNDSYNFNLKANNEIIGAAGNAFNSNNSYNSNFKNY